MWGHWYNGYLIRVIARCLKHPLWCGLGLRHGLPPFGFLFFAKPLQKHWVIKLIRREPYAA